VYLEYIKEGGGVLLIFVLYGLWLPYNGGLICIYLCD